MMRVSTALRLSRNRIAVFVRHPKASSFRPLTPAFRAFHAARPAGDARADAPVCRERTTWWPCNCGNYLTRGVFVPSFRRDTDKDGHISPSEYKAFKKAHGAREAAKLHVWETHRDGNGGLPDWVEDWSPEVFRKIGFGLVAGWGAFALYGLSVPWVHNLTIGLAFLPVAGYWTVGLRDLRQTRHAVRKNFPVLGNIRYLFEMLRPEIRQYFVEGDYDEHPYGRANRSMVYARAKAMTDTLPLGTRKDYYATGREWANHSLLPQHVPKANRRVRVGGPHCSQPYDAALLNVSAMSYGALSDNAILALNGGAELGNFYHNTGEGGISRFHLRPGGDIVWNVGTGYFGCRTPQGNFCPEMFKDNAARPAVKMIELKLSQGAKPAHGGMLPGAKVTAAIAEARGVPVGTDCNSPPRHSAFSNAVELVQFVARMRELAGGKPVGIKLCVGLPGELAAVIAAMVELGVAPDFVTVDGGEGGTGAAPPEFSNSVGMPLVEGLSLTHNLLVGAGLRDQVRVIASGKVVSGFNLARNLALGADLCNAARAMMFALGCIQALKCNTNRCPTGVATQDPLLMRGLDVDDKAVRVYNYQRHTVEAALEIVGAIGLDSPAQLRPSHIMRRVSPERVTSYSEQFPPLVPGCLLTGRGAAVLNDGIVTRELRRETADRIGAYWQEGQAIVARTRAAV